MLNTSSQQTFTECSPDHTFPPSICHPVFAKRHPGVTKCGENKGESEARCFLPTKGKKRVGHDCHEPWSSRGPQVRHCGHLEEERPGLAQ